MFSLNNLVLHTFEPRTENVVGDELIIDNDTLWIPTCQQDDPELKGITNQMYERLLVVYRLAEAKSKKVSECEECAVINFQQELDLLDVMPLRELFVVSDDELNDTEN
jgi:hypothetical protein